MNLVLTKVMKPLEWKSSANFSIGFTWPRAGNGMHTACGFSEVEELKVINRFAYLGQQSNL